LKNKFLHIVILIIWSATLYLCWEQYRRSNPSFFNQPNCPKVNIVTEEKNEWVHFYFIDVTTSVTLIQLAGSTDLVCEPPTLKLWDVDGDGISDLYFEECSGHGYLKIEDKKLLFIKLPDQNRQFINFWFKLIFYNIYKITISFVCIIFTVLIILLLIKKLKLVGIWYKKK